MRANDYAFLTVWRIPAPAESIFDLLADVEALPRWWPSVYLGVTPVPGREGAYDLHTKGWLPYTLRWRLVRTHDERPRQLAIAASGDFEGEGVWTLVPRGEETGAYTEVRFDWRIRAEKPLLRRLSWLLKPVFAANHRWAMARGEESLRRELARRP
jgi:uncharacterized protein YndB with AHSA1/START domain